MVLLLGPLNRCLTNKSQFIKNKQILNQNHRLFLLWQIKLITYGSDNYVYNTSYQCNYITIIIALFISTNYWTLVDNLSTLHVSYIYKYI